MNSYKSKFPKEGQGNPKMPKKLYFHKLFIFINDFYLYVNKYDISQNTKCSSFQKLAEVVARFG